MGRSADPKDAILAKPTALQRLLNEPKGKVVYNASESFMLHVFWEVPSLALARELMAALNGCAIATKRDTPCVPTYFFRVNGADSDVCSAAPRTVADCPALVAAMKRLKVGTPKAAVVADLVRKKLDPALLELEPTAALPASMQVAPVSAEMTEVYLDERAFMEHAGSKDYLDSYGRVMNPGTCAV